MSRNVARPSGADHRAELGHPSLDGLALAVSSEQSVAGPVDGRSRFLGFRGEPVKQLVQALGDEGSRRDLGIADRRADALAPLGPWFGGGDSSLCQLALGLRPRLVADLLAGRSTALKIGQRGREAGQVLARLPLLAVEGVRTLVELGPGGGKSSQLLCGLGRAGLL